MQFLTNIISLYLRNGILYACLFTMDD